MKIEKFLPYVGVLLAGVLLTVFEGIFLYRVQEQNLFLHTSLFFKQCMVTSGGLLTWAGAYLTQFFHTPLLGVAILCLLWAFLIFLLGKTFRLPRQWMLLTLVPVACLLLTITDLGYWIFFLKLRGHLFVATLGTIVAISLAWAYLHIPRRYGLNAVFIVAATAVGYPFFGFYALWATALMGVLSWRGVNSCRIVDSLAAIAAIVVIPLVSYYLLYHQTNIVNIYWTALPVFCHTGERFFAYNIPYIVLVASTFAMAVTFGKKQESTIRPYWRKTIQTGIMVLTTIAVALFWYKDDNFHRELSMMKSIEEQDWQQVVKTANDISGEPTRAIFLMRNLALQRLGRQGDELFSYPVGARRPNAPFTVRMVDTVGRLLYLEFGLPNYSYRWCMENGVEYGWTVEKLKLMVRCSLLNNEMAAVQKYLSMLKKTDFQQDWVKKYSEYLHHPQLIADDLDMKAIRQLERPDNFLTADQGQLERFLLEHFATAPALNPVIQEQAMIAAMQTKNIPLFWQQFRIYTQTHRNEQRLPKHYQEAADLFAYLQNEASQTSFDVQAVKDRQRTYYYDFYFNRYDFIER